MPEYQTFTMLQRHKAQLRDSVQLSGGIRLAAWFNSGDRVTNLSDHHTLSLYVADGYDTWHKTPHGWRNGGAPDLDPYKAYQLDGSLEYYFGRPAMASLGLFYKDVSTFIVSEQSAEVYGGLNCLINRRVNGDAAKVRGLEALVQMPFYLLQDLFACV